MGYDTNAAAGCCDAHCNRTPSVFIVPTLFLLTFLAVLVAVGRHPAATLSEMAPLQTPSELSQFAVASLHAINVLLTTCMHNSPPPMRHRPNLFHGWKGSGLGSSAVSLTFDLINSLTQLMLFSRCESAPKNDDKNAVVPGVRVVVTGAFLLSL